MKFGHLLTCLLPNNHFSHSDFCSLFPSFPYIIQNIKMSQDPVFELLAKQAKYLQYLKNFLVNSIDKVKATDRTKFHFTNRLKLLDQYWEKFATYNDELIAYCEDEAYKGNAYFKNDDFASGESCYISAAAKLANEIHVIDSAAAVPQQPVGAWSPSRSAQANGNNQPHVNYVQTIGHSTPKLPIPTFDGTQKEWDSFKELFTASIINDGRLSNIVKLQHLLNNVRGSAKQTLSSVTVSSNNFEVAWDKLLRRYDSNRRRLYVHLDALINLPQASNESAEELSHLVDKAEEAIKDLPDRADLANFVRIVAREVLPTKVSTFLNLEQTCP